MLHVLTNRRAVTDELMDSPDVDEVAHLEALDGLRRINQASRAAMRMLQPIVRLARREKLNRISLLDVACGGGDVPISVALGARQLGIQISLTLLDRSLTAVRRASAAAEQSGIDCRGVEADVLGTLPPLKADVVTNSLFLHHISEPDQVVGLLHGMCEMAEGMVVISDLRRSRLGLAVAWAGCRVLSRSRIVHHDGPASVRAAWTLQELADFAGQAGMAGVSIRPCAPWRMLLIWEKPQGGTA